MQFGKWFRGEVYDVRQQLLGTVETGKTYTVVVEIRNKKTKNSVQRVGKVKVEPGSSPIIRWKGEEIRADSLLGGASRRRQAVRKRKKLNGTSEQRQP